MLFGAAITLAGCEDILDTAPLGELNDETFYNTEQDFRGALLGTYSTLLNYAWNQDASGLFQGTYLPSDEVRCDLSPDGAFGRAGCNDDQFLWNAANGNFLQLWTESYKGIMRANMILQNLPEAEGLTEERKPVIEAEARFLRGYFYFFLARHFGDPGGESMPLPLEAAADLDGAHAGPVPTSQVWDQIEADLVFASQNMPESWRGTDDLGRADRYSAYALLGKVRVYRAQWLNEPGKYDEAIAALEAVRQSGMFRLMDDYGHNFLEAHQNNDESLFEVQMSEGTNINGWGMVDGGSGSASYSRDIAWGPNCDRECVPDTGRSYGILHVTHVLRDFFREQNVVVSGVEYEDPRRFYTVALDGEPFYADSDVLFSAAWSFTGSTPAKYVRPMVINTGALSPPRQHVNDYNNDRLIRYADVLLLLAEAYLLGPGDAGTAAELINEVRARARTTFEILNGEAAPPGLIDDIGGATFADLERERRLELSIEGHRYDDLVRWHRAGLLNIGADVDFDYADPNGNWSELHLLKPIPQDEIERNPNLSQNPGY